jgi:ribosomal protein L2
MVASITFSPSLNKLLSLVMFASGAYSYVVTTTKHRLFHFVRLQSSLWRKSFLTRYLSTYIKTVDITQGWYVLHQLPKNQPISLLELVPERGVQYTRAAGSKATMLKMDSRVGTGLVRLPSGVKKIFSIYAVASLGSVALPESRRCLTANAGFYRRKGRKPMVRGVAKNPVDHPHGGRTKTIANPRTPWGLPTKLK